MRFITPQKRMDQVNSFGGFIMQGTVIGMLSAYIFIIAYTITILGDTPVFAFHVTILNWAAVSAVAGSVVWLVERRLKISAGLFTRVPIVALVATSLVILASLTLASDLSAYAEWKFLPVIVTLPVAITLGSTIRPWKLLDFGTVAVRSNGLVVRKSSRSKLALAASLPLRLLGLYGLSWSVIAFSYISRETIFTWLALIIFAIISYFAAMFLLSYRSPTRPWLIGIAVLVNVPILMLTTMSIGSFGNGDFYLAIPCLLLLSIWALCIAARSTARLSEQLKFPLSTDERALLLTNRSHDCLGSYFIEWQSHST